MDTRASSSSNERGSISKNSSWFTQFRNASNPWMARYAYGFIFLLANLLAWAARDYGHGALTEMKRSKGCNGGRDCLGTEGVLRVSLGCFIFYIMMFLSTVGTSKLSDTRDSWHSGWWLAKIVLWISFTIIPFFLPSAFIQLYGQIAHFGAGVFLLIQLISIITFITWLNDWFQSDKYVDRCQIHVMLLATASYVVCLVGIILMYIWYAPEPSCLLNIFYITWTLVLLQFMTSVSLHPKVNAGILTPGLMGLYIVFLCWSAIRSEPAGDNCIRKAASMTTDWLSIISFVVAILVIVIATFSTGIDSKCFQFRKDDTQAEDDVPYGYGFFHFVFATGAMYFAMLLIGWNAHHPMRKWTIDVGWTSTWVRIVNEWLAVCVYLWMLVAPIIWKSRQTTETT
ncbi:Serinc-domain containing serine and sphingolipid biosynthesis protein [Quillaja saponaria]|uniref:Serinc-domain containing serine and sphingolipid biosynthesis protein n=1 Tax=Quillaja saponaria TaxID=32244 RepID=A0AAD7M449_QUISA|nr:Serinc-domain containing serine and sphingolipid biosynthesis protein [Quillaja saponaria]